MPLDRESRLISSPSHLPYIRQVWSSTLSCLKNKSKTSWTPSLSPKSFLFFLGLEKIVDGLLKTRKGQSSSQLSDSFDFGIVRIRISQEEVRRAPYARLLSIFQILADSLYMFATVETLLESLDVQPKRFGNAASGPGAPSSRPGSMPRRGSLCSSTPTAR